jgi:hypothetical protein
VGGPVPGAAGTEGNGPIWMAEDAGQQELAGVSGEEGAAWD